MASRTYLVGLYFAAKGLERYMSRWQEQIMAQDLTSAQITCFNSLLTAVIDCLALFKPANPTT
jgi:hypothetical protein